MTEPTSPTERRRQLAEALRLPMVNFEWWFPMVLYASNNTQPLLHNCGTEGCALGYAAILFPGAFGFNETSTVAEANRALAELSDRQLGDLFDMTHEQVDEIFYGAGYEVANSLVTPEMVADKLDALGYPNEHLDDDYYNPDEER